MATTIRKNRIYKVREDVKSTLIEVNENVLNGTEELLTNSIKTGEKWQELWAKALKNSEPLMEKQVDIVFDTLQGLADQIKIGRAKIKKLVGQDVPAPSKTVAKKTTRAKSVTTVTKKRVIPTQKKVVKSIKDDLTVIKGIGTKMEVILNNAGIKTYEDLAGTGLVNLKKVLNNAGSIFKLQNPSSWAKEAKTFLK